MPDKQYIFTGNIFNNTTFHINGREAAKFLSPKVPIIPKIQEVVGRDILIARIGNLLVSEKILNIYGVGGIGKSLVSKRYLHDSISIYDHVIWIDCLDTVDESVEGIVSDSFSYAISKSAGLRNSLAINIDNLTQDQLTETVLSELRAIENQQPGLLVIDDANSNILKWLDYMPHVGNWHVLISSRAPVYGITSIEVEALEHEAVVRLFDLYYKQAYSEDDLKTLLSAVETNTLLIELLAKTGNQLNLSLYELLVVISNEAADNTFSTDITVEHSRPDYVHSITEYIQSTFTLAELEVRHFETLLPLCLTCPESISPNIVTDLCRNIFAKEELSKVVYSNLLQLHRLGWLLEELQLEFTGTEGKVYKSYRLHKVIHKAIFPQLIKIGMASTDKVLKLVDRIEQLVSWDETGGESHLSALNYLPVSVAACTNSRGYLEFKEVQDLLDQTGRLSRESGDWETAIQLGTQAVTNAAISKADDLSIAKYKSNLANSLVDIGEYDKAAKLLNEALNADIKTLGNSHPTVQVRRSNLSVVYRRMGKIEDAYYLSKDALRYDIATYGEEEFIVQLRRSNMGVILRNLKRYSRARLFHEHALNCSRNIVGDDHPKLQVFRSNLAVVLTELGQYDQAEDLLQTALKVDIDLLGRTHRDTLLRKSNIAYIKLRTKDYVTAKRLYEEILTVYMDSNSLLQPDINIIKKNLQECDKHIAQ